MEMFVYLEITYSGRDFRYNFGFQHCLIRQLRSHRRHALEQDCRMHGLFFVLHLHKKLDIPPNHRILPILRWL